jgi:hypothetical protein
MRNDLSLFRSVNRENGATPPFLSHCLRFSFVTSPSVQFVHLWRHVLLTFFGLLLGGGAAVGGHNNFLQFFILRVRLDTVLDLVKLSL